MILVELLCRALNDKYGKDRYNYMACGNNYSIHNTDYLTMHIDNRHICILVFNRINGSPICHIIPFDDPEIDVFAVVCRSLYNYGYEPYI
jgi:hypothetical protein